MRHGAPGRIPDAVAFPEEGEIAELLRICGASGVRVVPRGGGTSVTGGLSCPEGEAPVVVADLERLTGLLALDRVSGLATFGAGIRGPALEASLAGHGLTLGHLPQSWELSTLGGWIVTRSSGQESIGVGRIEDLVAGLEVVAPGSRLILRPQPASAAGPDLRQLVMGSEGRLGIVTRATVRVRPAPRDRRVHGWMLPAFDLGLDAVRELARSEASLTMLRLSDGSETEVALRVGLGSGSRGTWARRFLSWCGVGEGALLLAGAAGSREASRSALSRVAEAAARRGAVGLGGSPGRRWLADRFRHPYLRDSLLDRGVASETFETACRWSHLPRLRAAVGAALEDAASRMGIRVAVLSHVSHVYRDGASLYVTFFYPCARDLAGSLDRWRALKGSATDALVAAGGTLSHHHGVGRWHAPWLGEEIGEAGLRVLRAAADALDPAGILSPGVLLESDERG
jgi:alkyldihydroxyacetonephosphate synthase